MEALRAGSFIAAAQETHLKAGRVFLANREPLALVRPSAFLENSGLRNQPVTGRIHRDGKATGKGESLNFNFFRHHGTITKMNQKHPQRAFFTVTVQMTEDKKC